MYNLVVALLPSTTSKSSDTEPTKAHEAIVDALERGEQPAEIAKRLHPKDLRARKKARSKIWRMVRHDPLMQKAIVDRSRQIMLAGLPAASAALVRRAKNGNIPAVKLHLEATGLHNPKVQHEHSGEITVKLDMPRPNFGSDGQVEAPVIDAEVIED